MIDIVRLATFRGAIGLDMVAAGKRVAKSLGGVPVLTILAVVITSEHAEAESLASR